MRAGFSIRRIACHFTINRSTFRRADTGKAWKRKKNIEYIPGFTVIFAIRATGVHGGGGDSWFALTPASFRDHSGKTRKNGRAAGKARVAEH